MRKKEEGCVWREECHVQKKGSRLLLEWPDEMNQNMPREAQVVHDKRCRSEECETRVEMEGWQGEEEVSVVPSVQLLPARLYLSTPRAERQLSMMTSSVVGMAFLGACRKRQVYLQEPTSAPERRPQLPSVLPP
jgi:hypothetical protein